MQIREHLVARNCLYLALDDFAMTSLSLFQPCALDIGISRPVEFCYERTDTVRFVFETQLANLGLNLSNSG